MNEIKPTPLLNYQPHCKRKPLKHEIELCQLAFGCRCCSTNFSDRLIDLYLLAFLGAILFIIFSLDCFNRILSQFIKGYWAKLIFKAILIFIILFLVDRWLVTWRKKHILCTIDG